uniref:Uncharacterized protein n=1 Tax=Arundo donax TaxID=35708 RepID=A0A0A8Y478_ARUDO
MRPSGVGSPKYFSSNEACSNCKILFISS